MDDTKIKKLQEEKVLIQENMMDADPAEWIELNMELSDINRKIDVLSCCMAAVNKKNLLSFCEAARTEKKIRPDVPNYNLHYYYEWIKKYFPRMKPETVLQLLECKWTVEI